MILSRIKEYKLSYEKTSGISKRISSVSERQVKINRQS